MTSTMPRLDGGSIPTSTINLQDPAFVDDPYPALRAVQEAGPVVYHEGLGQYFVSRWADCAKVLGNSVKFAENPVMFEQFFGGTTMIGVDDERHDLLRGVWPKDFQRGSVETKQDMITQIVARHLEPAVERLLAGEVVDVMAGFTRVIPTVVIANLLGLPDEDHADFIEWSEAMVGVAEGATDPTPRGAEQVKVGMEATSKLNEYLRDQYRKPRRTDDNLIARMAASNVAGQFENQDLVASFTQLVFAGNETTPKLMGTALYALERFPEQRALVGGDRSLLPQAIEEINRWMSAAPVNWRVVQPDAGPIDGVTVPVGSTVMCLQGIANRDPRRWEDPDLLDVMRPAQPHLGFGFGMHSCLGLNLARLEIKAYLSLLMDRVPHWRVHRVDWGNSWVARGPVSLEISAT